MILIPYSYDGTSLQSATYSTSIPREAASLQVSSQAGWVKRAGATPVYAGKDISPQALTLEILVSTSPSFMSNFEALNTLFDTKDETPKQLICTDSEDSNKQYYVYATPQQVMGGHEGNMAVVTLALDDPIWQTVTQTTQAWTFTGSTSTTDVTINGNDDVYPIFEISPTSSPTTDFIYSVYLQVLPQSSNPWTGRPLLITGDTSTTWDTAALVAAGKMQADGDDIRVFQDGVPVDFWFSGVNTTDTKVWVVSDLPEAANMLLKTAIGATDTVTEVELNYGGTTLSAFAPLPSRGRIIIDASLGSTDTEELIYTSKTTSEKKVAFNISARNARGTSAFAHAAGANVRFLPHTYRIDYGAASATTPTIDDSRKPLINLSTSSNGSFVYATFYDINGLRAGAWQPYIRRQSDPTFSRSGHFTSTSDEGDTDPATEMGLAAKTYESGGLWRSDTVSLTWVGNFPDYVTTFSASGEQNQTVSGIPSAGMAYVNDAGGITFMWTLSAQATTDYSTWTAWTKATTDATVPPNLDALRWMMFGTITGTTDAYSKAGASAVTVNMTNPPHVMIRPETSTAVKLNCTIANTTTGDSFDLSLPMEVNDTVIVTTDPDFPTVSYKGSLINGAIRLSSIRSAWMKLQPGSNTLTFDNLQSVANNFTINIKYRERMNFF
jgi:hypothetical protein